MHAGKFTACISCGNPLFLLHVQGLRTSSADEEIKPETNNKTYTMKILRVSLSVILIIYSVPTILSGMDIHRAAEPDLSSEWIVVTIFFILSVALFLVSLIDAGIRMRGH